MSWQLPAGVDLLDAEIGGRARSTIAADREQLSTFEGNRELSEHSFELEIAGVFTDELADALFEAGCDDATFAFGPDRFSGGFDRDAPSYVDAVISAIADVESVKPLEVLSVDSDDFVYASEIAERVGRSRQSIEQLVKGKRGPGGFPAPVNPGNRNPLWHWRDVEAWFAEYEGRPVDREKPAILAAINSALKARRALRAAHGSPMLQDAVRQLIAL